MLARLQHYSTIGIVNYHLFGYRQVVRDKIAMYMLKNVIGYNCHKRAGQYVFIVFNPEQKKG